MTSYKKLAKDLKVGDFVVAKNGIPCLIVEARRFKDRRTAPHKQMMGIEYEAEVEEGQKETFFAAFSLRFRVLVADTVS